MIGGILSRSIRVRQNWFTILFVWQIIVHEDIHTITLEGHELDVLIVKDSAEVPYYLEKEYKDKNVKNDKGKTYGKIVYSYLYKSCRQ